VIKVGFGRKAWLINNPYAPDQCSGGTVLENGHYDVYVAANAFDDNTGITSWISAEQTTGINGVSWIGYDFGSVKRIKRVKLYHSSSAGWGVTSVKVQYSDNGSSWSDAATVAVYEAGTNTIDISDNGAHRYWRLLANSNVTNRWQVYEIEMMEANV
jgi:hypothetical protein